MSRQSKQAYLTGNSALDLILNNISDRLDLVEGLRPELTNGYLFLENKEITTTTDPLGADEVGGTENQIEVVDNGDGTITLSTPQDIDTDADVEFDSATLDDLTASKFVKTDAANKLISSDFSDEEFEFYMQAVA
ncbi:MAG: hypothetical protein HN597_03585 [Desulfobacula sp.]|uniref:Uncharacterized protein n=1 Tax=uncultured marine virus TaxID=186617 RepID=A0A0F7L3P0_9VIRU|nr:hypothetical protein [uncultured marine virus]MBT7628772.1 hypothetical protein [Desulfobacula sp.]